MKDEQKKPEPWWKVGPMWLVVGGPVVVIVAAFVTLFIAGRMPAPVVAEDYYREGLEVGKMKSAEAQMMPAMQARHHAITPKAADGQAPTKP